MESNQPGNTQLPDFHQLDDRMIAEMPATPRLVLKTNLDPKDSTVNNPYYHSKETKNAKEFRHYFEE
jgi:hypothetical protein